MRMPFRITPDHPLVVRRLIFCDSDYDLHDEFEPTETEFHERA
jgi:hypothetical protein